MSNIMKACSRLGRSNFRSVSSLSSLASSPFHQRSFTAAASNLTLSPSPANLSTYQPSRSFTTSKPSFGLEEFFTNQQSGKTGRAWRASELRLKSEDDLRKLWFVLLKERNMLYTYKEMSKKTRRAMKNPERMEKVALSMCRIQTVMSERRIEFKSRSDKQWLDKRNTERAQRKTIRNKISAHKNQPKTCPSVLQPKRMIGLSNFRKQMMSKGVKPRKVEQEDDVTDDDFAPPKEGEKMAEHKVNIEL